MRFKDSLDLKMLKEKKLVNKNFLKLKILGSGEIKKIYQYLLILHLNKH